MIRKRPSQHQGLGRLHGREVVFLTVTTRGRQRILDNDQSHRNLVSALSNAGEWLVGDYLLMPDHLHLFAEPRDVDSPHLDQWIAYWKSLVTKAWHVEEEKPIWQRYHWDRIIRNADEYRDYVQYVNMNPVTAGLVEDPTDWPYRGRLNTIKFL